MWDQGPVELQPGMSSLHFNESVRFPTVTWYTIIILGDDVDKTADILWKKKDFELVQNLSKGSISQMVRKDATIIGKAIAQHMSLDLQAFLSCLWRHMIWRIPILKDFTSGSHN